MDLASIAPREPRFRTAEEVRPLLERACEDHPDVARFEEIGRSEQGRPIDAVVLGRGPKRASLIAGAHAEEPVGPETLRTLVIDGPSRLGALLDRWTLHVVPQINPDGEARNRPWTERWPDPVAFLKHAQREPPGRDLEFGYPDLRAENGAVSEFLRAGAPLCLHMSLHGMAVAEGGMLLIERHWIDRTEALRADYTSALNEAGIGLHDHDRKGDKGFLYLGPGFWSTPEGAAMRRYFRERSEEATARLFRDSSMEFVRSLGGDPLCLVTEIPLFLLSNPDPRPGVPSAYLDYRAKLPDLVRRAHAGEALPELEGVHPVAIVTAMRLQLRALELGLAVS